LPGIEALIVGIAIAGVFAVAARQRFSPRDWVQPTRPYEDLRAELGARISFAKGVLLAVMALAALASVLGFLAAAPLAWRPAPDAALVLRPARTLFVLPGVFIGIAAGGLLDGRIDRWILKERCSDGWFVDHGNRSRRARPPTARDYLSERRALALLMPILAAVGLIASCLALDAYAYVTPSEIVVNPFFGFQERHHPYTDVRSIDTRLIGKRHDELECQILFNDGSILSTDAPPARLTNAETDLLAAYVYERTTAPWTHHP
jgi:hypothetical protein